MAENLGGIYWTADIRTQGLIEGERAINRSTKRATDDFDSLSQSVKRTEGSLFSLNRVASAVISTMALRQIIGYADAFTNVQNRLKVVTDSSEQLADVTQKVADIARESRSNLESTAVLYSRTARATEELNISQERLLAITETITKSFTLSGATAQEASNAIRQLSQGLASGALRGEEFNSVAEQAPEILRAVSKETGKTIGELREFAAEGGITAELLIRAIENYADTVETEFAKTQATFSQSLEVSRTNVIQFVGELDSAAGVVGFMGDSLVALSQNLQLVAQLGAAIAALYGARVAGAFITSAAAKVKDAAASAAQAAATRAQAAAAVTATQAEIAHLRAVQAGLAAQLQSTTSTAVQAQLRLRLAQNTAALIAANNALAASNARVAASGAAAGVASRAVAGGLALLGGPVGAAIIAAIGIGTLTARYIENSRASEERNRKLAEEIRLNGIAKNAQDAYNRSVDAAYDPVKRYADAQKEAFANELQGASLAKFQEQYDKSSKNLERAEATLRRYSEMQSVSAARMAHARAMVQKYKDQLEVLKDFVPTLTTTEEQAAKALAEVTQSIEDQIFKIREGAQAYDIMIAQRRAGVTAMSEEGQEIARLIKQRDAEQASLDKATEAAKNYQNLVDDLLESQREMGSTEQIRERFLENLRLTGEAAGKSKEDIDALAASYRELWSAQDQQSRDNTSEKRLEQLKQEIALQNIRNQLGNEQAEIQAAIMALGENATPEEQQEIANLVAQMQALRAEAELLGPTLQEAFSQTVTGGLDQLAQGLASIVTQGASARKVIANLAGTIANELLASVIRYWVGRAAAAAMGSTQEVAAQTAAETAATTAAIANIAAVAAASTTAGATVASAWAPAAIAASIATGGSIAGAAVPIFSGAVTTMSAALAGSSILSGAAGAAFGGGRATGGAVSPNTIYRVNEKEPEMFVSQGQQYLMPNMRGEVMNSKQVGGNMKSTVIIENHTGAPVTTRDESTSDERIERVIIGSIRGRRGVFRAITETTTATNKVGGG